MLLKVDDDFLDEIVLKTLIDTYFSTEARIDKLEDMKDLKPHQKEDLRYDKKYLKAVKRVIIHFSPGLVFNEEAERFDYIEREGKQNDWCD
jgi:hypothetical protein